MKLATFTLYNWDGSSHVVYAEVQLREVELVEAEVAVKVQLIVTVPEKKIHKYKSKKSQKKG
jgi:hypothetical protein